MTSIFSAKVDEYRVQGHDYLKAAELAADYAERAVCVYSARHKADGVKATQVLDCGPVGKVDACDACADFYARNK